MIRIITIFLLSATTLCVGCGKGKAMSQKPPVQFERSSEKIDPIDKESAIAIAKEDAAKAFKSLEAFDIFACETKRAWYVLFELKDGGLDGGAPIYVIDKKAGTILRKTYYQ